MSTGFRLFLLTICAFGAIAVYRLRTPELSRWLRQTPSERADPAGGPLVSPVDRILEPDVSLAMIRLSENPAPRPPVVEAGDMEPAAAQLSGEEILEGADLPVEEEPGAGEEPPAGVEPVGPVEPPAIEAFDEIAYEVKAGDSLWRIAARFLGSGSRFPEIRDLNRDVLGGRSSDVVPAGTVLRILVPASPEGLKVPGPQVDTSVEGSPAPAPPRENEDRTLYHTVRRSENLQRIAQRYFPEDADGWKTIFAANKDRLDSPDLVREGQVLRIPPH